MRSPLHPRRRFRLPRLAGSWLLPVPRGVGIVGDMPRSVRPALRRTVGR